VPESETVVGLPTALCTIAMTAVFSPVFVGVNVALTVHVALGTSEAPQVVVLAN
jgi:hypothetical protein